MATMSAWKLDSIYRYILFFLLWSVFEGIGAAARTDESHQISSWSEQRGGVIPFRSGCLECVALSKVNCVSTVCFRDAMLQHPEAVLGPFVSGTQKVTS